MIFFGLLTLGSIIGWLSYMFSGDHGVRMIPSIIIGAISALVGGVIVKSFNLVGAGYYAAITTTLDLFTINSFRKQKPIFSKT